MAYEPLHHKYRPQTFGDLVGQETIALTLSNALEQAKIAPAYLFTGPRGTGKTSSARILAKSLNCLNSDRPTPYPCGKCEVCLAIAKGAALDVMEIDAASNTGVDNIREIIERSRFAPVQCRYKIYVIDECLKGDSLIQTDNGLMRIDDPSLEGKKVLSYNESQEAWEYKRVLRWLERGIKKTVTIKTDSSQICCTSNHLIRTQTGWIEAKNVKEGMKILSPVSVDAGKASTNMVRMDEYADLRQDISLEEINSAANHTTSAKFLYKQNKYNLCVDVDAKKNSMFQTFCKKKAKESKVFNLTGTDIRIKKVMDSGISEAKILSISVNNYKLSNLDLSTEPCLVMEVSNIPTSTADTLDYDGLTVQNSINGWNTKQVGYSNCAQKFKMSLIEDMAKNQPFAKQLAILSYKKFMRLLNQIQTVNQLLRSGFNLLLQKDLPGGTWMMVLFTLVFRVIPQYIFTPKDFLKQRIKLLLNGSQIWDILPVQNLTLENLLRKNTSTSNWEQNPVENGCQIYNNIPFRQWTTNLETVESVNHADHEQVYDLEVEDNHNFVANGLLVHNCHMLSTAAFNALLKTLEEPPPQVVFILATTDPQRVLSTIISRCQRFDYRRIPLIAMTSHLRYIADAEAIAIADDALTLVAQIANGGLRDAESLLDQLSLLPEKVTVEKVWDLVGAVPEQELLKLLQAINGNDSLAVLQQCRNLLDRGREPLVVLQNLAGFYLNLLIAKTAPNHSELTAVTETCWQQLCAEADNWQTTLILRGQQHLQAAETQLKRTTQPRLWLEVALLGLLPEAQMVVQGQAIATPSTPENNNTPSTPKTSIKPVEAIAPQDIAPVEISTSQPVNRAIPPSVSATAPPNTTPQEIQEQHLPPPTASTVSIPSGITSEPILPSSQEQDPVANQQIWSKVVSCLQPPTTQALLKQQCHLVNFDGMSAIVGVSSANLQKMTQQKIPNIEAAFAQVCQRKVRVQLEVVSSPKKIATNSTAPINQTTTNTSSVPEQPPDPPPPARVLTVASIENVSMMPQSLPRQQNQATLTTPLVTPPVTSEHSQLADSDRSNGRASSTRTDTFPVSVNDLVSNEDHLAGNPEAEVTLNENYEDSNLQQAIASLTQNFEGEVVQLDKDLDYLDEDGIEVLPQSDDPPVLFERPDVEEYDDEW
jgi:DNA polymerase III subunit gamma/tau